MKKIIAALLILSSLLMMSSCSASLVNLKYEDGKMLNKRLKLEYYPAPTNYEPVSVGEAYGYYGKSDMILYEIKGLDPKEWLTQEYAGSATTIFYSTDITLPTLEELEPNKLYICSNEETTFAVSTVEDVDLINELVDLYINGEYEEWPLINSIATYELKFYSEDKYPHIYYNLTYGEFEEGKFIYDRNTKRSVRIDEILSDYIG
ncbi:MAG: hypothetical protein ACI4XJ_05845 [Eubacteriales bacterium]